MAMLTAYRKLTFQSGVQAVLRWALLLVLVVYSAHAAGQSDRPETATSLRFRRVFVLADRLREWPKESVAYIPVDPVEFEKTLAALGQIRDPERTTSSAFVHFAQYYARLIGSDLVDGQAILQIRNSVEQEGVTAPRVLEPLSVAVGQLTWADRDGQPASWGFSGSGKHKLVVDGSGILMFPWRAAGQSRSDGSVNFALNFPAAGESRLIVDAPVQMVPHVDLPIQQENLLGTNFRRWVVFLGGRTNCQLSFTPEKLTAQRPSVAWSIDCEIAPQGLQVQAEMSVDTLSRELRDIEVTVPAGVCVTDVTRAEAGDVRWTFLPGEKSENPGRLLLSFSPPIQGTQGRILIRGISPTFSISEWRLASWGCAEGLWTKTRLKVRVTHPLRLISCDVQGGYRLAEGESAENALDQVDVVFDRPDGQVILRMAVPPGVYSARTLTYLKVDGTQATAQVAAALRALQGEVWTLTALVPENWVVDGVEANGSEAIQRWEVERNGEPKSSGRTRLRIELARPLSLQEDLVVKLVCRGVLAKGSMHLGAKDLLPVRWENGIGQEDFLVVSADKPWRWDSEAIVRPAGESAGELAQLAQAVELRSDLPVWGIQRLSGGGIVLADRPGYSALTQVECQLSGDSLELAGVVVCFPEPSGLIDRVDVMLMGAGGGQGRTWTVRRCRFSGSSSAEPRRVLLGDVIPSRVDWQSVPEGELWSLTLGAPSAEPVAIEFASEIPCAESATLPVIWLPDAEKQTHRFGIRGVGSDLLVETSDGSFRPSFCGLLQIDSEDREVDLPRDTTGVVWFQYQPPSRKMDSERGGVASLQIRRLGNALAGAWIWSVSYETLLRPGHPIRHRALILVESQQAVQLECHWSEPVRFLAAAVNGVAPRSLPTNRKWLGEQLAAPSSSFTTANASQVVDGKDQGVDSQQPLPEVLPGHPSFLQTVTIPIPPTSQPMFVEIVWEERTLAGWICRWRLPRLRLNYPIFRESWRVWSPPDWVIEKGEAFPEVGWAELLGRLFGPLARGEKRAIFNPLEWRTWDWALGSDADRVETLERLRTWADQLGQVVASSTLKGSNDRQLAESSPRRKKLTWAELLANSRVVGSSLSTESDSAGIVDNENSQTASVNSPGSVELWIDGTALAELGITPNTPVAINQWYGMESLLRLLERHSLSLIAHPRLFILTSAEAAAGIKQEFVCERIDRDDLGLSQRYFSETIEPVQGQVALSTEGSAIRFAKGGGNGNSETYPAEESKQEGKPRERPPSKPSPVFPSDVGQVLFVSDRDFDRFVDDLLSLRISQPLRFVPAGFWGRKPVSDFWEGLKGRVAFRDVVDTNGWKLTVITAEAAKAGQLVVTDSRAGELIRVLAALVVVLAVLALGIRRPWPTVYWLLAALSVAVGLAPQGAWTFVAGGALIGLACGVFLAAVWGGPGGLTGVPAREVEKTPEGSEATVLGCTICQEAASHSTARKADGGSAADGINDIHLDDTGVCPARQASEEGKIPSDVKRQQPSESLENRKATDAT